MKNKLFLFLSILFFGISCKEDLPETSEKLFNRSSSPVFESSLNIAADPSIIRSNDTLFMYYSAENQIIGVVLSLNGGDTWISPNMNNEEDYPALSGQADNWDNTLETIDVIKTDNIYRMYYAGYREGESDNDHVENYEIGLATSLDGIHFTRHPQSIDHPILARDTSNDHSNDRHAITSPGVVYHDDMFYMIYAGWNVTDDWTGANAGIRIMGATSSDGINWSKLSTPIILPSEVTYSPDINEASLLISSDGYWYILFSTGSSIGIARATNFSNTYDIYPEAIVTPEFSWESEVTAPDGIIENGTMRIWYHGVKAPLYFPWVIGYSEAKYPLNWN